MTLHDRKFYEHHEQSAPIAELVRVYCCPCCGYPILTEPASYEICPLCSWEDDGCDGGGPNACGLAEAREYFKRYLTSYSPTHEFSPQFQRPGYRYVHQDELRPENLERKRRIMVELERYMAESDTHKRGEIWKHIIFR